MPITVLSWLLFAFAPSTPFSTIADLAGYLSQNNAPEAIGVFDSGMKDYGRISQDIEGLEAQDSVSCSLDVVEDVEEPGGGHALDVDWFMQITNQLTSRLERRRERVRVEMRLTKGKWKIIAMNPISVLEPIAP